MLRGADSEKGLAEVYGKLQHYALDHGIRFV